MDTPALRCDVLVIGAGMAGMAAAAFAGLEGLRVVQAGSIGQSHFASGLLDFLAVHPVARGRVWDDPFQALEALIRDEPTHPYALLGGETIREAFDVFTSFLDDIGLPYRGYTDSNAGVITPVGTVRKTFRVPAWMWNAQCGLRENIPALLVDFAGLKGFSASQIAQTLGDQWSNLSTARLSFPQPGSLYPEHMAMAMEVRENREKVADMVKKHLPGMEMVGFPAILGISKPRIVYEDMERLLGVRIFEIPTMPPSVTGMRLKAAYDQAAPVRGIHFFNQKTVRSIARDMDGFRAEIGGRETEQVVRANAVILASGRFFGKGLLARRKGIVETVFDLPVEQPDGRAMWHREDLLAVEGHLINRSGLRTDSRFRPLAAGGRPAHERLYAVGSILAHHDWMRQKCGSGLAIATAYAAVRDLVEH